MMSETRARSASKGVQAFVARLFLALASATGSGSVLGQGVQDEVVRDPYGAIVRGDVASKKLAFIFTGDEFGESAGPILDELKAQRCKGSFFVTGKFLRDPKLKPAVRRMVEEGHYLGPHSDAHPLYCDWDSRDKSLVTEEFFTADLEKNLAALRVVNAMRQGTSAYFVAPYEWYNRDHVAWSRKAGVELVNFTPGSGSNRDYMREDHPKFVSSRQIRDDILAYEQKDPHGLNGFLLLLHVGTGRRDPFHTEFRALCEALTQRGYEFVRVDELLGAGSLKGRPRRHGEHGEKE